MRKGLKFSIIGVSMYIWKEKEIQLLQIQEQHNVVVSEFIYLLRLFE